MCTTGGRGGAALTPRRGGGAADGGHLEVGQEGQEGQAGHTGTVAGGHSLVAQSTGAGHSTGGQCVPATPTTG